ncbi:MAG TPA: hypothetical protein PLI53_08580, partial [Geobacteraceae bacterium]|nr:hypothetical protein [Geobacteraceae bacterium]
MNKGETWVRPYAFPSMEEPRTKSPRKLTGGTVTRYRKPIKKVKYQERKLFSAIPVRPLPGLTASGIVIRDHTPFPHAKAMPDMFHTRNSTIEVVVPLPLDRTFHYSVPERLRASILPGIRVLVPFGRRKLTGYVLGPAPSFAGELKDILEVLDAEPLFTPRDLAFYRWIASYYLHSLGEVIKTALPTGINIESRRKKVSTDNGTVMAEERLTGGRNIRRERFYRATTAAADASALRGAAARILLFLLENGETSRAKLNQVFSNPSSPLKRLAERELVEVEEREVYRDPFREEDFPALPPLLLDGHQAAAFSSIAAAVSAGGFAPFLLHGVTGSGKTEVYLQAIAHALDLGKRA